MIVEKTNELDKCLAVFGDSDTGANLFFSIVGLDPKKSQKKVRHENQKPDSQKQINLKK